VEGTDKDVTGRQFPRLQLYATALVILTELAHLTWEHFHGGIRTHHFLARADMPAIYNGWGLLLLPVLTWFVTGRIEQRIALQADESNAALKPVAIAAYGFAGALLFGIALANAFANGYEDTSAYLLQGILLLAILLPVYRTECLLGFVLGMTFTFGAVLPVVIGSVIAVLSAFIHRFIRPAVERAWRLFTAAAKKR
jgi:hypothetical protein